mgnify:CR=1 FL=1
MYDGFFSAGVIAFKVFTWSDFQKMLIKRCEDSDFQQHFSFENPLDDACYNAANRIVAHHLLAELGSLPGYVNHPDLLNLMILSHAYFKNLGVPFTRSH